MSYCQNLNQGRYKPIGTTWWYPYIPNLGPENNSLIRLLHYHVIRLIRTLENKETLDPPFPQYHREKLKKNDKVLLTHLDIIEALRLLLTISEKLFYFKRVFKPLK